MLAPLQLSGLIIITVSGLIVSYALHIPLAIGFLFGFLSLLFLVRRKNFLWEQIWHGIRTGAGRTKEVVWILLLIGLLIPAWTASGTIPYLIELGLSWVHPAYFFNLLFPINHVHIYDSRIFHR